MEYKCPSCNKTNQLKSRISVGLSPTGGGSDVTEDCPNCKAFLSMRVIAEQHGIPLQLIKIEAFPPRPDAWNRISWLGFLSKGEALAVRSEKGVWLTEHSEVWRGTNEAAPLTERSIDRFIDRDDRWRDPSILWARPKERATAETIPVESSLVSSSTDNYLLCADSGEIFNSRAERMTSYSFEELGEIKLAALRPDLEVLTINLDLTYGKESSYKNAWYSDATLWSTGAEPRKQRLSMHDGISMGGRYFASPDGSRVVRAYPAFNGSKRWRLELYQIEPAQETFLQLLCAYEEMFLQVHKLAFEESGDLLIAYSHYEQPTYGGPQPYGLVRLDGQALRPKWRCPLLPIEMRAPDSWEISRVISLDASRALLLAHQLYLVSIRESGVEIMKRFETPGIPRMVAYNASYQSVVASTDYGLWEFSISGNKVRRAKLPIRLPKAQSPGKP